MVMLPYDERREHLLGTAARVFAAQGFHSTTMRDLARETGMSLAGMYHYVSGKDELLYLIQQQCFTAVLQGAQQAITPASDPRDRLERFIRHHVTFFAGHMDEMQVLSHEAESLQGERLHSINQLKRQYVALLTDTIRGLDSSNGGRRAIDSHVASYALFGMMNWIYNWYDPAGPVSPETLSDQFARLFLDGLTTSPPSAATSTTHNAISPGG